MKIPLFIFLLGALFVAPLVQAAENAPLIESLRLKANPTEDVIQFKALAYAKLRSGYSFQLAWKYPFPLEGEQAFRAKLTEGEEFGRFNEFKVDSVKENQVMVNGFARLELIIKVRYSNKYITLRLQEKATPETEKARDGEFVTKVAQFTLLSDPDYTLQAIEGQKFQLGGREYTVLNVFADSAFVDPKPVGDEIPEVITITK